MSAARRIRMSRRFLVGTTMSLLVTLGIVMALGGAYRPAIEHHIQLRRLMSDDFAAQRRAETYFATQLRDDEALRERMKRWVTDAEGDKAARLIAVVKQAGLWGPGFGRKWFSEVSDRLSNPDPAVRVRALHDLARLNWAEGPSWDTDSACANMIELQYMVSASAMLSDPHVQYNTLLAAATLKHPVGKRVIRQATHDDDPTIARHAWIMIGLSDHAMPFDLPETLHDQPPSVAEAALFAAAMRNVDDVEWLMRNLQHPQLSDDVRDFLPYIAHCARGPWRESIVDWLRAQPVEPGPDTERLIWRMALADPLQERGRELAASLPDHDAIGAAVASWRTIRNDELPDFTWRDDPAHELTALAQLQSLPVAGATVPLAGDLPDLARLYAVRGSSQSTPLDLLPVFASDQPTLRDVACHIAIQRFSRDGCDALILELLGSYDDPSRTAGAVLAGLTGTTNPKIREIIRRRAARDTVWLVQQHNRLAMMMLGEAPDFADTARLMMDRDDVPRTTLIMALLHVGRLDALDWLINPLGEPPVKLRLLFDQLRWWEVLSIYLPQAPEFWVWADPQLQDFQVDVIRDWYLMQRGHLTFDAAQHAFVLTEDQSGN